MTATAPAKGTFGRRVTGIFSTKVVVFGLSFATTLIVSRILGRERRGAWVNLISMSGLAGNIGVFGIPSAIIYYTARKGSLSRLIFLGIVCALVISGLLMAVFWLAMPWLQTNMFSDAADYPDLLRLMPLAIPAALLTTFTTAVLVGRQRIRTYSTILVSQAILTLLLAIILVWVLRLGVEGAVMVTLGAIWAIAVVDVVAVVVLARRNPGGDSVPVSSLLKYGVRVYPASITSYFNYRIDTLLMPILLVGQAAELGLYTLGVTMAELIFYIPDSVAMIFLPRVASLSDEDAARILGRVTRLTLLLTGLAALAMVPTAWIGIHLVLPGYVGSLAPCYVLLPAIMALSLSKVLSSYISGRGDPSPASVASTMAVASNVVANIILMPRLGIVGAALASVISYSVSAAWLLVVAHRISGCSLRSLVLPGRQEVLFLISQTREVLLTVMPRNRAADL